MHARLHALVCALVVGLPLAFTYHRPGKGPGGGKGAGGASALWRTYRTASGLSWNALLHSDANNWTGVDSLATELGGMRGPTMVTASICRTDHCHDERLVRCDDEVATPIWRARPHSPSPCASLDDLDRALRTGVWWNRTVWHSPVCSMPRVDHAAAANYSGAVLLTGDSTLEELALLQALAAGYRGAQIQPGCDVADKRHRSFRATSRPLRVEHLWLPGPGCTLATPVADLVRSASWKASLRQAVARLGADVLLVVGVPMLHELVACQRTHSCHIDAPHHHPYATALRQLLFLAADVVPRHRILFVLTGAMATRQQLAAPKNGRRAAMCNERVARWAAEAAAVLRDANATVLDLVHPMLSWLDLRAPRDPFARQCSTQGKHLTCLPNSSEPSSGALLGDAAGGGAERLMARWHEVVPPPAVLATRVLWHAVQALLATG